MYVWSLHPDATSNPRRLLSALTRSRVSASDAEAIECIIARSGMANELKCMMQRALRVLHANPNDGRARSTLLEFLAGLDYAASDASVGWMRRLKAAIDPAQNLLAVQFLYEYCQDVLRNRKWQTANAWFMLRVKCMDAYVLCWLLASNKPIVVYYAGKAHTNCASEFLKRNGAREIRKWPPIVDQIRVLCEASGILHFEVMRIAKKTIVFVGENHTQTALTFATGLIRLARRVCREQDMLLLIEKHISNHKDPLQCELMCNQPHLAIHRARCDAFIDAEYVSCPNLHIEAVDNRHVDLGFLRTEIMDMWEDDEFRSSAIEFQRRAVTGVCDFCARRLTPSKKASDK